MVVPLETVRLAGLNELELMTTVLGGGGLFPLGLAESLLHPNTHKITRPIIVPTSTTTFIFKVVLLLLFNMLPY